MLPLQAVEVFGEEEEEDESADIAAEDKTRDLLHQAMLRRTVDGVEFTGVVVDIQCGKMTGEMLYLIQYEDGDFEHMTEQQVKDFVVVGPALGLVGRSEGMHDAVRQGEVQQFSMEELEEWRTAVLSIPCSSEEELWVVLLQLTDEEEQRRLIPLWEHLVRERMGLRR